MLNADSEYLDVCWDFMKPFLQTAYQNDTYMMPVLLDALKADVDECDAYDEYENSRPTYYINDEELELPYISDEAKENFYDQISSINALYFTNKDIIAIVEDTVMAGCENGSTPEEVASSIQVQVQDYLS